MSVNQRTSPAAAVAAALMVLVMLLGSLASVRGDSQVFKFVEDPALDAALSYARARFMATRPGAVPDRLDAALTVRDLRDPSGKTWRRGAYNADELAYPASCVKLTYLASTVHWLLEQGRPFDDLDFFVHPMIVVSSNLHTGMVVDSVTGALNNLSMTAPSPDFDAWLQKRRYTAEFLDSRGLLENQTVLHKTYPTNSGFSPCGAEALARQIYGMNLMCPRLAVSLMMEVALGYLEPEARAYMLQQLLRKQWDAQAPFGLGGLPPGTLCFNKPGDAYNDENDIAFLVLPNGREVALTAFSDALEPLPGMYELSALGAFASFLFEPNSTLCDGCPPRLVRTAADATLQGAWHTDSSLRGSYSGQPAVSQPAAAVSNTATWSFSAAEAPAGLWEVSLWSPQSPRLSARASVSIGAADGGGDASVDQTALGGRWLYLGDFLTSETSGLKVTVADQPGGAAVAVDALRIVQWPACRGVVGLSCAQLAWREQAGLGARPPSPLQRM